MYDLRQLIQFPFADREWAVKFAIGTIITIIPILNIIALGYYVACIDYGMRGRQEMPDWRNWAELIRDGFIGIIIVIIYLIVPAGLGFILHMVPLIGMIIASVVIILVGLMIPMALAHFARYRNIKDAFMIGEIFYYISQVLGNYFIAYFTFVLLSTLGLAILVTIPFIGFIGAVLVFYCCLIFSTYMGILYKEAIAP